jgi:hypothetical protein
VVSERKRGNGHAMKVNEILLFFKGVTSNAFISAVELYNG